MNIIKLSAIDSTNSYLKEMAGSQTLENYTTVVTDYQKEGRGQRGSNWKSDKGKNLTFSTLKIFDNFNIEDQSYLSMAVSLAVHKLLENLIHNVKIKWPNDILAESDKIAGILIENTIRNEQIVQSVIGIGLNINQEKFDASLTKVTSLKILTSKSFQLDILFKSLLNILKKSLERVDKGQFESIKRDYLNNLYRYKIISRFTDNNDVSFSGKIIDIDKEGRLVVQQENDLLKSYQLKEIRFTD